MTTTIETNLRRIASAIDDLGVFEVSDILKTVIIIKSEAQLKKVYGLISESSDLAIVNISNNWEDNDSQKIVLTLIVKDTVISQVHLQICKTVANHLPSSVLRTFGEAEDVAQFRKEILLHLNHLALNN